MARPAAAPPAADRPARRRGSVLAALTAASAALHLVLLGAWQAPTPRPDRPQAAPAADVAVVTVAVPPLPVLAPPADVVVAAVPAAAPVPTTPAVAPRPARAVARPPERTATARAANAALSAAVAAPAAVDPAPPASTAPAPFAAPDPPPSSPTAPPPDEADPLPLYPTRLPPPTTLRYALQRGAARGTARLDWRPEPRDYALSVDAWLDGAPALRQTSQGGIDAAGLGPVRHTDARRRRAPLAVNFQRDAARISFSGPSAELALAPGLQDGASWMVQLAGIVAADPARFTAPAATVVLGVVGVHAERETWRLRWAGREPVETPAGRVDADRYVRDADGVRATQVDVWLDPLRHHLPVRARLQRGADGVPLEYLLEATEP